MSQTQRRLYIVSNPSGLHMRPLQAFVEQASRFQSSVQVGRKEGEMLNGKSLIHLLGLGAEQGTEIVVEVSGPDADSAIEALWEVLQKIYDE
jgi:phosphotransferase system HPr (HPr) family protein